LWGCKGIDNNGVVLTIPTPIGYGTSRGGDSYSRGRQRTKGVRKIAYYFGIPESKLHIIWRKAVGLCCPPEKNFSPYVTR
jgi:hypothetical protein